MGLEGADLVLRRQRYDPVPLVPASGDGFTCEEWGPPAWWGAPGLTLAFTRDSQNAISGFLLDAGRIRHLRFVRKAE